MQQELSAVLRLWNPHQGRGVRGSGEQDSRQEWPGTYISDCSMTDQTACRVVTIRVASATLESTHRCCQKDQVLHKCAELPIASSHLEPADVHSEMMKKDGKWVA